MAMTMSGEQQLPAPRETVWAKLNDPEVLKACIPGCESLEVTGRQRIPGGGHQQGRAGEGRFKGKVRLTDLDPPNGYKISGEGDGGIAGFAKGGASGHPDRQGWRHAADLQRRGPDRRQARPARPAAGQRRGQEARRRFFRQIRRGGEELADPRSAAQPGPLTLRGPAVQVALVPKSENGRKTLSFVPICVPGRKSGVKTGRWARV